MIRETAARPSGLLQHALPFAVRLRAHSAGLEQVVEAIAAGGRSPEHLLAVANGPLPLLSALVAEVKPARASVVGILPVRLLADVAQTCEKALAHRASAEAEVLELQVQAPAPMGALDQACEVMNRLLAKLPGAQARIDWEGLVALAEGAGLPPEGAAKRLATAGVVEVRRRVSRPGAVAALEAGPLPVRELLEVPGEFTDGFVAALLAGPPRPLALIGGQEATGVWMLRAAALARLAGHQPVTVVGGAELKGPDAALCFGADRMEAELDPAGTMGSRTRAYGEAAIRGAQLEATSPRRRAEAQGRVAHILDEVVDPAHLPGGDPEHAESRDGGREGLSLEVLT